MGFEFLGLAYDGIRSNFSRLDRPYKLNFAITMWCQSRCMTCNIWQLRPKGELTIDEIREFARKNTSFRWIGLTGGEPFLRSDIVEIVKAFKENSKGLYLLTMPTNSLCNQETVVKKLAQILELGIPKVVITLSLDGHRELHDKVRGVQGNYDKVISMYKALTELRKTHKNLSFVFGYTISKINEGQFQRTYDEVKREIPQITYNDFHINVAQLSNNYYHNTDDSIVADRGIALGELENIFKNSSAEITPMKIIERQFLRGLIEFVRTGEAPRKCRSLDASLFMDNMGNIYPSIMWDRKVANLREIGYDLSKVWNGEDASQIRSIIDQGMDPIHWTSCEAYQSIVGSALGQRRAKRAVHAAPHEEQMTEKIPIEN
ncbi:MAG: radical SAM protein [Candidatus Micrarchaeota archaeon]|nr:radical SAM protein [Candidatus Micrarchaeota archaeon]MDE1804610.1 radical SAM protein [Candidatus Micrarchaeota archaeon]